MSFLRAKTLIILSLHPQSLHGACCKAGPKQMPAEWINGQMNQPSS